MACYHPLKAFVLGEYVGADGKIKKQLKVCSYDVAQLCKIAGLSYLRPLSAEQVQQVADGDLVMPDLEHVYTDYITIPCGKCIGCRLEYSRQWANRCLLELGYHKSSYFVTLTYDDAHLPTVVLPDYADTETGEVPVVGTLVKRDYQLFVKRLRKSGQQLRYYAAGEYGDETFRPHYHAIMFGLELNDLRYWAERRGNKYYRSAYLESVWQQGMVIVGEVTWESCAYTARYVLKKAARHHDALSTDMAVAPEFVLMSRRPGIGYQYFADNYDNIYKYEYINVSTLKGGKKFRPPKYFDTQVERLGLDDVIDLQSIKDRRKSRIDEVISAKLKSTDLKYEELLQVEEENLRSRLSAIYAGRKEL